ncbi:MAG: TIGR01777 family protein [Planctomycetota bacterium]|nr:MAG: TIGR01777 family protein [Planctomycetota bacterium]
MRILISGSSGLLGAALRGRLAADGHEPLRLVRRPPLLPDERQWNPAAGGLAPDALDGVEVVLHLAGTGIAERRWSPARKAEIRDSRVRATSLLAHGLAQAAEPPRQLICASAVGYYGERGDQELSEDAAPGAGFLAQVCRDWEAAAAPAADAGVAVAQLRFGVVLAPRGGALKTMLTPFRLGLGGRLGSGQQWMSWITLDDALDVVATCLQAPDLIGPINAVSPEPITNAEFSATLGRVLRRPAVLPMPAFAARLAFGEMADALLLASTRAVPTRLSAHGHVFGQPRLEPALRDLLA